MGGRYRTTGSLTYTAHEKPITYTSDFVRWLDGVYYLSEEEQSYNLPTYREGDLCAISDVIGAPALFNGCTHTRRYLVPISFPSASQEAVPSPLYVYWNQKYGGHLPAVRGAFSPHCMWGSLDYPTSYSFGAVDWDALIQDVGDQLSGAMDARANILVFLGEARQTIRMFKNPFGLVNTAYRGIKNLNQFLKLVAGGWLEYKWGWKQLDRDMTALFSSYDRARIHRSYLQETRSRYTGIHARDTSSVNVSVPYPQIKGNTDPYHIIATRATAYRTCTFGVEILRGAQYRIASQMETMLEGLGAKNVLEAAWDLIPFSFLVDWFVDIGRVVATDPILWNTHRLRRIGHSTKIDLKMAFAFHSRVPQTSSHVPIVEEIRQTGEQTVYKSYTRVAGFPATGNADLFGNFRLTNIADGAALMAQRLL